MAEHAMYFTDERAQRMYKIRTVVLKSLVYLFLTLFALFMLTPFVVMIIGSFVEAKAFEKFESTANFSYLGFANWTVDNYATVFTYGSNSFPTFFLNTFIVAIGGTTVTVVTAVLAAFAFARLNFKGKDALFALLLATINVFKKNVGNELDP